MIMALLLPNSDHPFKQTSCLIISYFNSIYSQHQDSKLVKHSYQKTFYLISDNTIEVYETTVKSEALPRFAYLDQSIRWLYCIERIIMHVTLYCLIGTILKQIVK